MAGPEDLLSADEIEALIHAAKTGSAPPASGGGGGGGGSASASKGDLLDPSEIEALMAGAGGGAPSSGPSSAKSSSAAPPASNRLRQNESAAAGGGRAPASSGSIGRSIPAELGSPSSYQLAPFDQRTSGGDPAFPMKALQDVELDLRIELGRTELLIEEVLQLREGSVVPLDKLAGDPVDIIVNGRLIARGEVLVLNDNFCVRVAEILTPEG